MSEKDKQESREIVAMLQGMKQEDRLMAKGVITGLSMARISGTETTAEDTEKSA